MHYFNVRHSSTKLTILNLVKCFQEQGSVAERSQPGQGYSVCRPENTENVQHSIEDNPTTYTQRCFQKLAILLRSLQWIQKDLNKYTYKVQSVQSLQPLDMQQWLTYADRLQEIARNTINFIHNLIMR